MLLVTLVAAAVVAITVAVHAMGFALVLWHLAKSQTSPPNRPGGVVGLVIRVTWLLIIIHSIEIAAWGASYWWLGCMPDAESAMYFSGVTYTTVGYGDHVLTRPWRVLAPIEALTGILMCGLSAGLFFAILTRIYTSRLQLQPTKIQSGKEA